MHVWMGGGRHVHLANQRFIHDEPRRDKRGHRAEPGQLSYHGPIITSGLTIAKAHADALTAAGDPVPPPVPYRFLIDTGADGCVVKHEFAVKAGLKLINANSPLAGVGVDTTGKTYIGRVLFGMASKVIQGVQHGMAVDTQIMSGDLNTVLFDGLIGRDVLRHFVLTYDGKTGRVTMRYHKPTPSQRPKDDLRSVPRSPFSCRAECSGKADSRRYRIPLGIRTRVYKAAVFDNTRAFEDDRAGSF